MRPSVSDRKRREVGGGIRSLVAGAVRVALAAATVGACTATPPPSLPSSATPPTTVAPGTAAPTVPAPSILPSASPGFAFDPDSIVGYYKLLGFACISPRPSVQAAGYWYRVCTLTDPAGRTLTMGLVTDPGNNIADASMRVHGAQGEAILDPSLVLEPFARFLGAILGDAYGSEVLPWLAGHLGDTDTRITLGELVIATYTPTADDHTMLEVEIANHAYLQAPRPSASAAASSV